MVNISLRRRPSEYSSLPMMLIARTLDLSPSLISKIRSTRFWSSWTILGSTDRRESALAAIKLDDPVDVGADLGAGEDLARRKLDFRRDLVVLDPLVALKDDAVDHRVFANRDDQVAGIGAGDHDVREQFGRVEVLQRLIERFGAYIPGPGRGWNSCGPFPARGARDPATRIERIVPAVAAAPEPARAPAAPRPARAAAVAGWRRPAPGWARTSRQGWSRPEGRCPSAW